MKSKISRIVLVISVVLVFSAFAILRPVPIVTEAECIKVQGIVNLIKEGGENDVVFKINDDKTIYYINRGLEQNLTLDKLRTDLIGKEIDIYYPEYWTPLDWNNSIRHISKVEYAGVTIWSELKAE